MQNNITQFYEHDHDELEGYFQEFRDLKVKNYQSAKDSFEKFESGLQRHIAWEENILFPLFEEKTGMKDFGPTVVMREEHKQIKQYLKELYAKINQADPNTDSEERLLLDLLREHNEKEENILYPAIDHVTTDTERKIVFDSMGLVDKK